jgi:hypothetical protein
VNATVASVIANRKSVQVGRAPEVDRAGDRPDVEDGDDADADHHEQQDDVGDDQAQDALAAPGREAEDVAHGHVGDDPERHGRLGNAERELPPEHREVVGDHERRDRDEDEEVQEDRPGRDERPQLVERVAGEHRRPGALLVQRGALDVGERRQDEEEPGDEEDERRGAERVLGHDAEHEVQGGRDRRVDDREQRRRAEAAPDERPHLGRHALPGVRHATRRAAPRRAR